MCICMFNYSPILWVAEYKFIEYIDGSSVAVCLTQALTNWNIAYFLMTISIFFILPLIMLIILYGIIAKHLISSKGAMMLRIRPNKPELSHKARKQVVLMLGAVILSFFLCLMPFRLLTLWIILSSDQTLISMGMERYYNFLYFCRIMLYLNSAINPLLYNLMSTKFRRGFLQLAKNIWNYLLIILTFGNNSTCTNNTINRRTTLNGAILNNCSANHIATNTTTTSSSILTRSSQRSASEEIISLKTHQEQRKLSITTKSHCSCSIDNCEITTMLEESNSNGIAHLKEINEIVQIRKITAHKLFSQHEEENEEEEEYEYSQGLEVATNIIVMEGLQMSVKETQHQHQDKDKEQCICQTMDHKAIIENC